MRLSVVVYKHSILATLLSLLGLSLVVTPLIALLSDLLSGKFDLSMLFPMLFIAAVGVGLMFLAESVSDSKLQKLWIRQLKKEGMEPKLAASAELAVQAYYKCSGKKTLKFIRGLNPAAAERIEAQEAQEKQEKKRKKKNSQGKD